MKTLSVLNYGCSVRHSFVITLLVISLLAAGCGSDKAPMTVSPQARQAVFNAVSAALAAQPGVDPATENPKIAAVLAGRSELEASGISDGGSDWGRFPDGRLLVVVNNRPVSPTSKSAAVSAQSRAVGTGLPQSTTALLFDAMGTAFSHPAQTFENQLAAHGYSSSIPGFTGPVQPVMAGTVEQLKAVKSNGIFYMNAHGGTGYLRQGLNTADPTNSRKVFAIWTGSTAPSLDDPLYRDDLDHNRLCYMIARADKKADGTFTTPTHYAFTQLFVDQYMKFGQNSLVYIDACSSNAPSTAANNFRASIFAAGAGVYIGWSSPTPDGPATQADLFLFDRLVGDNTVAPKDSPAKPPLDWAAVQAAMAATKRPGSSYTYDTADPFSTYPSAKLLFTAGSGDLGVIVPSITAVSTDTTTKQMTLSGIFGPNKGIVVENASSSSPSTTGKSINVISWTATQIVTDLPTDITNVCALVNGRWGNIVPVTGSNSTTEGASTLVFTYTYPDGRFTVCGFYIFNSVPNAQKYVFSSDAVSGTLTKADYDKGTPVLDRTSPPDVSTFVSYDEHALFYNFGGGKIGCIAYPPGRPSDFKYNGSGDRILQQNAATTAVSYPATVTISQ